MSGGGTGQLGDQTRKVCKSKEGRGKSVKGEVNHWTSPPPRVSHFPIQNHAIGQQVTTPTRLGHPGFQNRLLLRHAAQSGISVVLEKLHDVAHAVPQFSRAAQLCEHAQKVGGRDTLSANVGEQPG